MSAAPPSILLVEDHVIMGRMLSRLLCEQGNMDVWAVVTTAEAALEALADSAGKAMRGGRPENDLPEEGKMPARKDVQLPDLVLVDVSLPGMSGIALMAELARLYPDLPCLIVSAHRRTDYVQQALDNGGRGYVAKDDPLAIIEAVGRVLAGEIYLSDAVRRAVET